MISVLQAARQGRRAGLERADEIVSMEAAAAVSATAKMHLRRVQRRIRQDLEADRCQET